MTDTQQSRLPYGLIILLGCFVAVVGFGPRATMGFFLTPVTVENGWSREVFSLAIAVQNLAWGVAAPFAGMLADRFGTARVLVLGAVAYALSLYWMSTATDPLAFTLSAGVLMGVGIAGCGFFLILAAFTRLLPAHLRSVAFGLGTAAGSMGQFIFAPLSQWLLSAFGWRETLLIMAVIVLVIPFIAVVFRGKPTFNASQGQADQTMAEALREAFGHNSYILLVFGFFVCGWHVAFITTHLPPFIADFGIDAKWGAWAIALIGLFNMAGAFTAGILGGKMSLRYMLSFIYLSRAVVITIFIILPISVPSILAFSAAMGLLWLSTVPPTQGLVTKMFGTRYVATLFGFVFLSHQIGAFLGVWLGGVLYDTYGNYDVIWWISIALGILPLSSIGQSAKKPLSASSPLMPNGCVILQSCIGQKSSDILLYPRAGRASPLEPILNSSRNLSNFGAFHIAAHSLQIGTQAVVPLAKPVICQSPFGTRQISP